MVEERRSCLFFEEKKKGGVGEDETLAYYTVLYR